MIKLHLLLESKIHREARQKQKQPEPGEGNISDRKDTD